MIKTTVKNGKKKCKLCGETKEEKYFGKFLDKNGKRYINSRCKNCASLTTYKWNLENKEKCKTARKEWKEKLYTSFFEIYGSECVCCGEKEKIFLTIDHINSDGCIERKKNKNSVLKMIRESIKEKRDDLQVLCWNCNCGRQRNKGICPHKLL